LNSVADERKTPMDPVTIAAAVGALFVPYFKKAAAAFAGEAASTCTAR